MSFDAPPVTGTKIKAANRILDGWLFVLGPFKRNTSWLWDATYIANNGGPNSTAHAEVKVEGTLAWVADTSHFNEVALEAAKLAPVLRTLTLVQDQQISITMAATNTRADTKSTELSVTRLT